MTANRVESPYFHNKDASRGKVFLTNFADYLITALLTFFLFIAIAYPIVSALPSTEEGYTALKNVADQSSESLLPTRLKEKKADGDTYRSNEERAKDYIVCLAKTSYFDREKASPLDEGAIPSQEDTFWNNEDYAHDPLGYYFIEFKEKEESLNFYTYGGTDYRNEKETGLYQVIFAYENADDFQKAKKGLPLYQQLKPETADDLMDFLAYGSGASSAGSSIYRRLESHYLNALETLLGEAEENYSPYLAVIKNFNAAYSRMMRNLLGGILLSYVAAFLVAEGLLPLFFHNHRTLAAWMMHVGYSRLDGAMMEGRNALAKGFFRFLLYFSGITLSLVFSRLWNVLVYDFGGFSLYPFVFLSLALDLFSLILMLASKHHQGISELFGEVVAKDIDQKEGPIPQETEEKPSHE